MGTNANLVNSINKDCAGGSRKDQSIVWSYVVFRLANPTQKFLFTEKENIFRALDVIKITDDTNIKKFKDFANNITSLLAKERPLFCNLVFEYLQRVAKNLSLADDCCKLFEKKINNSVFDLFTERKNIIEKKNQQDLINYNYCNMSLTSPEYQFEKSFRKAKQEDDVNTTEIQFSADTKKLSIDECEILKLNIDKANGIHNHIAYLFADSRWIIGDKDKNYSPLILVRNEINVLTYDLQHRNLDYECNFIPQQIFASFENEPIGHLAFNGFKTNKDYTFVSKNLSNGKIMRISAAKNLS